MRYCGDDAVQVCYFLGEECLRAGFLGDSLEGLASLLGCALGPAPEESLIRGRIHKPDGEDLHIFLLHLRNQFVELVVAVAIFSVGDENNGLLGLDPLHGFLDPQIDGIVKGRSTRNDDVIQGIRDHVNVVGVVFEQLDLIAESDQKDLVLGVARANEGQGGLVHQVDLMTHAAAGIDEDAHADGHVLLREGSDVLGYAVFIYLEVLLLETGDEVAVLVMDRCMDHDQIDVHPDSKTFLLILIRLWRTGLELRFAGFLAFLGLLLPLGLRGPQRTGADEQERGERREKDKYGSKKKAAFLHGGEGGC